MIKHLHLVKAGSVEGVMFDFPQAVSIQHPAAMKERSCHFSQNSSYDEVSHKFSTSKFQTILKEFGVMMHARNNRKMVPFQQLLWYLDRFNAFCLKLWRKEAFVLALMSYTVSMLLVMPRNELAGISVMYGWSTISLQRTTPNTE